MIISKSSEKFKEMKDRIKFPNKYKYSTISDDLQVLEIALKFNLEIELLLYNYEEDYKDETKILLEKLKERALEYYEISSSSYELIKTKENHAGIIASIKTKEFNINDFKNKSFIVVLDRLEIPGNVGTIYRTLDSINCDGLILVDSVTKYYNSKITSSSRGSNLTIPTLELSYDEALNFLLNNNYNIYLGEPKLGKNYKEYDYKKKIAIVFGNERFGINPDWYNHKHIKVFIPMEGNHNSLNVAVATSIICYEAYMKRKKY